jgi:membrane protease YdiL (CAAX protease family)
MPPLLSSLAGLTLALAGPLVIALVARSSAAPLLAVQSLALLAMAGLVAAVLLILTRWEGLPLAAIGLHAPSWRGVAIGIGIAALFIAVIGPLLLRMPGWLGLAGFEAGRQEIAAMPVSLLLLSIIIVGAAEEVLYRGYAIERLEALTGSVVLACALSSAVFALAHVPLWGWGPSLTTLISGAIFAALYAWQRDLFPLILAHILTDIAGLALTRLAAK